MSKMKLREMKSVKEQEYFEVYSLYYENSETGHMKQYDIVSRNKGLTAETVGRRNPTAAVAILPVDKENKRILLTREFPMPVNEYVTTIPAGLIDPGEDPETAAARELREETGCIAGSITILPPSFSCIGLTDEAACAAIAIVTDQEEPEQEENEEISSQWYSYDEVFEIMTAPDVKTGARAQLLCLLWLSKEGYPVLEL